MRVQNNIAETAMEDQSEEVVVESRFGKVSVQLDKAVFFPQGLLGLQDNLHFVLTDIPQESMGQFKLLQCLNDHSLSFVVLPINLDNPFIEKEDINSCCSVLNVDTEDLLMLLIISVQRSPESMKVTANVRAPIIVDINDKAAVQYVFPNNKYEICKLLSE